jgi:hypothetical protein
VRGQSGEAASVLAWLLARQVTPDPQPGYAPVDSMRLPTRIFIAFALGCSAATAPPEVLGEWGGQEASLILKISGGTINYLCGAGTIDSAWVLAPNGQFVGAGRHYFGGGPISIEGRTPHPARYQGQVEGRSFVFTVEVTDLKQTYGPFHLVRGGPPVFELCV